MRVKVTISGIEGSRDKWGKRDRERERERITVVIDLVYAVVGKLFPW